MEDNFVLSEKRTPVIANVKGKSKIMFYNYDEDDVKELIKLLKEDEKMDLEDYQKLRLMQLAGDKLTNQKSEVTNGA